MTNNLNRSGWFGLNVLVISPTPTCPINFGNRRRIFNVCQRLQQKGAKLTYLHYPSEADWRQELPSNANHEMSVQWNNYFLIPVTKPLHNPPLDGLYHKIDEWWDQSIGDMIDWVVKLIDFDVCIVNYTWMAKAFEHIPSNTLKILDSHDKFAGRREMLEENGIPAEFFYTTEREEAKALSRADVIWAIKPEEEYYFRKSVGIPVLTLLHSEILSLAEKPRETSQESVITFGIIGAGNNINISNFQSFLDIAYKFFHKTLAPCRFIIAGSCSSGLMTNHIPFVTKIGIVEDVGEFYRAIDVVLGPMSFSSGLKIKMGEALGRGKAIIAHQHCFEGYKSTHPFHTLPSFEAILKACLEVINNRKLIAELEDAATRSIRESNLTVEENLEKSLNFIQDPSILIVVSTTDLGGNSLVLDHVLEVAEYLSHQVKVSFWVDGPATRLSDSISGSLRKFGRIFYNFPLQQDRDCNAILGEEIFASPSKFEQDKNCIGIWFSYIPKYMDDLRSTKKECWAVASLAILSISATSMEIETFTGKLVQTYKEVSILDVNASKALAITSNKAERRLVPFLWRGRNSKNLESIRACRRGLATIFVEGVGDVRLIDTLELLRKIGGQNVEIVYNKIDVGAIAYSRFKIDYPWLELCSLSEYFNKVSTRVEGPFLAIQIGENRAIGCVQELCRRAHVPFISLYMSESNLGSCLANRWREYSPHASLDLLSDLLLYPGKLEALTEMMADRQPYENDAGWAYIWNKIRDLKSKVV